MVTAPIWKDTYYTTSTSPIDYYITVDGLEIFRGRGVIRPDADNVKINVARICENYLSTDIPSFTGSSVSHPNAIRTFTLKSTGGTTLETYKFLNCWDRNVNYTGGSLTLSYSHTGAITGQKGLSTSTNGTNVTTTISTLTGTLCGTHALYYLNRAGGWCSLPITGKVVKKDTYDRHFIDQSYDNNTIEYQKRPYRNNISSTYEMHTGWVSEEEGNLIAYNLLSTNNLYIHDICNNNIFPAYITDTNVEYKTFKNGRKLINYTINAQTSQSDLIL